MGKEMKKSNTRVIQSIERAVSILDYLCAASSGARLTTLSRDLELNKSTAYSLISSLEILGLVRQDEETGRYTLGIRMLQYGLAVQNQINLVFDAQPYLDQLSAAYGETVHMAVLSGNEIVYIAKAESNKNIRMVTQIGGKAPAYCSALGKVMLAALSAEKLAHLLETAELTRYTDTTICTPEALQQELMTVRMRGYAYDREEREPGLFCISAPVLDANGSCVAAISISLPAGRSVQYDITELTGAVQKTAAELSLQLGSRKVP